MEGIKYLYQYTRDGVELYTPNQITAVKRRDNEDSPVFIVESDGSKAEFIWE